jgi:uncharacterized tellurite resistance protein B-like protein
MTYQFTTEDLVGLSERQLGAICEAMLVAVYADGQVDPAELARVEIEAKRVPWPVPAETISKLLNTAQDTMNTITTLLDKVRSIERAAAQLRTPTLRAKTFHLLAEIVLADKVVTEQETNLLVAFGTAFDLSPDESGQIVRAAKSSR